jgi:hypothetical protein
MLSDALQRRWNRRSCGNLSAIFVVNIGWTPVQEISLLQYISVSFPPIFYQTRLLSRLSNLFYCQYHECTYKLHSISCKGHVTCRRGFFIDGHFDCKLYTESVDIFCWHQIWWLVTKTTVHLSSKYLSIIRLLARVLKEGVQFRYNDTSTVRGVKKMFLWQTFEVYVNTSCQYLFQARSKFFKHTWLCEFVLLCFFTYDIFIQPGTPSNWSNCLMYNDNENWSYFVSEKLIYLGK